MTGKTPRLLVVDGSNLLFQMFFGMPARIVNEEGRAIHGTLGFIGALRKMIIRLQPTHAVVLFDGEHGNTRSNIDPDYKAHRPDISDDESENPFGQLPDIYASLDFLGIQHAETEICEADDWMASYALSCADEFEIILASFDSDLFQLISERVSVFRYRGDQSTLCTPQFIRDRFGIEPDRYADFKSMVGDTADNIKGAPGIGPKNAAELINRFGGLDNIINNSENIQKPSIRRAIAENVERLKLNLKLIRLAGEHPVPFPPSELLYCGGDHSTRDVLRNVGVIK